jgi:dTDP-4-dehydrorhamnose 3,5-epimerase-like enzyme
MPSDAAPGYEVLVPERKVDPRGTLVELVRDIPGGAQLYCFTIQPGQSRGGHWHRRKREWFSCLSGSSTLTLQGDAGRGERVEVLLSDERPTVVRVDPGVSHTFWSEEGALIVACISESFDPEDPDTFYP